MPPFGGMEGLAVTAALSGAGMLLQQNAADEAAAKQQRIIRQGQEEDARLSRLRESSIQNFADENFSADKRNANYEAAAAKSEADLTQSLSDATGDTNDIKRVETEGNLSGDYLRGKGQATVDATADIMKRLKLLSRANASGLLYNNDTTATNKMNESIAKYGSASRRNQDYTNTRLSAAQNKGSLVGGLMQGLAPLAGMATNKWADANMWGGV